MPTEKDYIDRIAQTLNGAIGHKKIEKNSQFSDIFEGYIWSLVIKAAEIQGAQISYEDVKGTAAPRELLFRTSPGNIYSTANDYTHAILAFPGVAQQLEAHIGVYVSGQSRTIHECDVLVLSRNEASICRRNYAHPRAGKVLLAAECKYYTTNLGINLARSFLGLRLDIKRDNRFFVSNTSSQSVEALLADHKGQRGVNVNLLSTVPSDNLLQQFVTVFRDFKAKGGKI